MSRVRKRSRKVVELVLVDCGVHFLKWRVSIFRKQTKKRKEFLFLGNGGSK